MKKSRRVAAVAAALAVPLLTLSPADAGTGADPHPFEVFRDCPAAAMVADGSGADSSCVTAVVTGGQFVIGKGTVPITAESRLSLGLATVAGEERSYGTPGRMFVSKPMQVPGGLLGVPGLERLLPGLTDVTATVELATTQVPEVDVLNSIYGGEVVALPIKIRLRNALLGNKCYIGSDKEPIVLHLTNQETAPPAPNRPITGKLSSFNYVPVGDAGSLIEAKGGVLVDNAFAVPAATGCGAGGLLNAVVNQRQGLPSPAGRNTAILEQDAFLGGPAPEVLAFQRG